MNRPFGWLVRGLAEARTRRLDALDLRQRQERLLLRLVRAAAGTRFGRAHGFASIRTLADFRKAVPLRTYEDFWREYWSAAFPVLEDVSWPGRIPFFALTSGTTTGRTKYIPLGAQMLRANRRASLDVLAFHFRARPGSRILGGRALMLGGSTALTELAPGVCSGDLSGIVAATAPRWVRPLLLPKRDLALLENWEEKLERIAHLCLDQDIRVLTGTPSWLLILIDHILALRARRGDPRSAFPKLELLIHGGVNFAPYRHRFEELLGASAPDFREVYPASEGFFAAADREFGAGLRLNLEHGVFFEFVPVDELGSTTPTRHWVGDAQPGVNYALVVSTCAGLWGYLVGDTVRLVSRRPARVLITGRTSYSMSAFGEHLIGEEIESAVSAAAAQIGADVTDYAMGALFPSPADPRGRHVYYVEFGQQVAAARLADFARLLDQELCSRNDDYRAHRGGGFAIQPPQVVALTPGSFVAWMRAQGRLGGQHKVPRVIHDSGLLASLDGFSAQHGLDKQRGTA
jgi:hypothetical protein